MITPLISFITSCKSRLHQIKRTFRSVVSQGGEKSEYILVDYLDPDQSAAWIFEQELPNAKALVLNGDNDSERLFNQPKARNAGASYSDGDYLCFIDGDTGLAPDFFEMIEPHLRQGRAIVSKARGAGHSGFFVVHRDDFEKVGRFDEAYDGYGCDDTDFLLALDRRGIDVRTIPADLLLVIDHPGSDRVRHIEGSLAEATQRNRDRFRKKWNVPWNSEIFHELERVPAPLADEFRVKRGNAGLPNPLIERLFRHAEAGASADTHMAAHMPMLALLASQSPGPIVECGTYWGYSTMALLAGASPHGIKVHSYDPQAECERWVRDRTGPILHHATTKHIWEFKKKLSWDAAKDWDDKSVGLWFLDTSHTHDDTVRELDDWLPKMMPNGIMCGHDYWIHLEPGNEGCDVKNPVDDFARRHRGRFDLQIFPHDFGFFILWPRT